MHRHVPEPDEPDDERRLGDVASAAPAAVAAAPVTVAPVACGVAMGPPP